MSNVIIKKRDGMVTCFHGDDEVVKNIRKECINPCADCENAYACKCEKIAGEKDNGIIGYDFISDGFQTYKYGKVDEIFILKCNNFEKDHKRAKPTTREEIERLRKLKESIKILYFDASDIEEADRIQTDLGRRGQIFYQDDEMAKNLFRK